MPSVQLNATDKDLTSTSALLTTMQKNNQRGSSPKCLVTGQPREKVPEMPSLPTTSWITDMASSETGQIFYPPGLTPPPADAEARSPTPIFPKDTAESLATEPEKGSPEAQNQKANHLPQASLEKLPEGVRHKKAPEVLPYFYQINWPQEILKKWAREKEDREKSASMVNN